MPEKQASELTATIAVFEKLIDQHKAARLRLVDRRADALPEQWARLDTAIAVNGRTLDSLEKALAAMRGHLGQLGT
jgi:hypothetical protein